jgi:hypothetical protein
VAEIEQQQGAKTGFTLKASLKHTIA